MKIEKPEILKQALANMRLENLNLSSEVAAIVQQALTDPSVDTDDIKKLLFKPYTNEHKQ